MCRNTTFSILHLCLIASLAMTACGMTPAQIDVQAETIAKPMVATHVAGIPSSTGSPAVILTPVFTTTPRPTLTELPTTTRLPLPTTIKATPPAIVTATAGPLTPGPGRPTASSPQSAPSGKGGPLTYRGVTLIGVQRIAGTPNDALATLSVEFSGGVAPYKVSENEGAVTGGPQPTGTFVADGKTWLYIHFTQRTSCGASLTATVTVTSSDGQRFSKAYYAKVNCP